MNAKEVAFTYEQAPVLVDQPALDNGDRHLLLEQCLAQTGASATRPSAGLQQPIGFSPQEISALINTDVVGRYIHEAPFLWLQRDRAVAAPHYSLQDLAKLDERLEAQLDGLRVAGEHGWGLAAKALDWQEPGEVFTAGLLALESNRLERLEQVLEGVSNTPELQRSLISAAGWVSFASIRPILEGWFGSENATRRRLAIGAYAVHRQDPGKDLRYRLEDKNRGVRARALKAAAELGRTDLLPVILRRRSDKDSTCWHWAAWAAARLGDRSPQTMQSLQVIAGAAGPQAEQALALLVRCLPLAEASRWLRDLWKNPNQQRLAAIGAGVAGDPELVGWLIKMMTLESLAPVAGEAFSLITGADLKYLDLDQDPPRDPREDDEEYWAKAHEVLDVDGDLPYPAVEKVVLWWRANQHRFRPGQRYLCGCPIERDSLQNVLQEGKQRQRAAAALELALLQPTKPLLEVRARGDVQERSLAAWTS
jgi:uncharacterized protein (TIGR02270 family)